jgi:lysophospholipase L1-like esterase
MKKIAIGIAVVVLTLLGAAAIFLHSMSGSGDDPAFFESEIRAYEDVDRQSAPEPGAIVFVGSSSIRFWSSLEEDFAPLRVLNRGFGGAHFIHVVHNTPRIVLPYAPRAVVVYAGDNDIGAGTSIEEVVAGYRKFVDLIHAELPTTAIYYLPIKPSKLRWGLWPQMSLANAEIEAIANSDPRLHYLDVATPLLGADGKPRDDVFRLDGLHLSAEGYTAWTEVVRPVLIEALSE